MMGVLSTISKKKGQKRMTRGMTQLNLPIERQRFVMIPILEDGLRMKRISIKARKYQKQVLLANINRLRDYKSCQWQYMT